MVLGYPPPPDIFHRHFFQASPPPPLGLFNLPDSSPITTMHNKFIYYNKYNTFLTGGGGGGCLY